MEKKTLMANDSATEEMAKSSRKMKMRRGLLNSKILPLHSSRVIRKAEMLMVDRLVRPQPSQWIHVCRPIIFMASFSRCSFSYTMALTVSDTGRGNSEQMKQKETK